MKINGRSIGATFEPFIVAEIGANHNHDFDYFMKSLVAARKAGADAVKLQTYTPDSMTIDCNSPDFLIKEGPWKGKTLYQLYQEAAMPLEWHYKAFEWAKSTNYTLFSTPFDEAAVDFLEQFNPPAYKIASFEIGDGNLIRYAAKKRRPMIISTGMATLKESFDAESLAYACGADSVALLHCVSGYPTPIEEANIQRIDDLYANIQGKYATRIVGLSDHTLNNIPSICAIGLDAAIIEKHFTLDKHRLGPDMLFSICPREFEMLVHDCKMAWLAMSFSKSVPYTDTMQNSERYNANFKRSLYVVKNMKKGEEFTPENLRSIRPGYGMSPTLRDNVMGAHATCDIERGTALQIQHVDVLTFMGPNGSQQKLNVY